ncbi:MAG TPA: hypothetical protein VGD26_00970 [Chitinophagaceae bacterium]
MDQIKTTNEELSDILAGFARQSVGLPPEPPAATDEPKVEPTEEPKLEDVSMAPPKEEAKPEVEPKKEEVEGPISDWDTPADTTPEAPAVTPKDVEILSELGSALGLEKVTSKEDILKAVSELSEKAKGPDTSDIHPELLKAIELSKKGGDFYEYLKITSVDYSKADPVTLYEDYVIDQLTDANGNVNEDEVNDYLDNMKESEKRLKGIELQKRLVYEQQRKAAEIESEAIQRKEKQDIALKAALGNLQEIDGFKVSDSHRKEVFSWVTSKMMKDLFYGPDGNLDPQKVAKVAFRNLYHDKLHAYQMNKIKHATARDIYADVTNQQIKTTSSSPNPTPKKGYDIGDYIQSLEEKMKK